MSGRAAHFASKEDLVLAYLQARHEGWLHLYHRRLAAATDARAGIVAVYGASIDHDEMARQHGFRGGGLLNAAAELPAGAPGRSVVRRHKEEVEALLAAHVADLGTVAPQRVAPLAEQLPFMLEGAVARAGLDVNAELLHHARDLAVMPGCARA